MGLLSTLAGGWQAYVLVALGTALLTGAAAYKLHSMDVVAIEAARDRQETQALAVVQSKLISQCQADKAITEQVSNEYETSIATLNKRLADIKRVRPASCIAIKPLSPARAISGPHAGTGTGVDAGPHGIDSEWLYDFAAEAEQYRLRLIGLQAFVKRTWVANE